MLARRKEAFTRGIFSHLHLQVCNILTHSAPVISRLEGLLGAGGTGPKVTAGQMGRTSAAHCSLAEQSECNSSKHVDNTREGISGSWRDPDAPLGVRVEDLLQRLSLAEKVQQLSAARDAVGAIERLGIPAFQGWNGAAVSGQNLCLIHLARAFYCLNDSTFKSSCR